MLALHFDSVALFQLLFFSFVSTKHFYLFYVIQLIIHIVWAKVINSKKSKNILYFSFTFLSANE